MKEKPVMIAYHDILLKDLELSAVWIICHVSYQIWCWYTSCMSDVALQAAILMNYVTSLACLASVKENTFDIWHLNWLWYCLCDNDELDANDL